MNKSNRGHFVWHELLTPNPNAAVSFYGEVIGWKTQPFGDDYQMWLTEQGPMGGLMKLPEEAIKMGAPPHWIGSVQVADVDATSAQIKQLGGKIYKEAFDVPTVGRVAIAADPQGAVVSIFQPLNEMSLHDMSKSGEFCWNELVTTDSGAAFAFYSAVFGWKTLQEMDMGPMGTYRIYGVGDTQLGGMMTTPPGSPMPAAWLYYTETENLDATIQRATRMGATLCNGPMDIPGGGRIAQLTDPQGAAFALHQSPPK